MKRRAPATLWLLHRPPEPDGTAEQRSAWAALTAAGRAGAAPRVLVETPPVAWRALQAALGGRGVELREGWSSDEESFLTRLRGELRARRYDALVVSGAEASRRWLSRARSAAPDALLACHLPDPASLAAPRKGDGPTAAAARRETARRALTQADEVWCDDAAGLAAARALLRGAPAPAARLTPALPGPRRPVKAPRVETVRLPAGSDGVAAANAALRGSRAPLVWLLPPGAESDPGVLRTLAEGLAARPYAGGAAPLPAALAGRAAALKRAAWALHRKGDWHEADHLARHPSALLRREALEACGLLDERCETLDAALLDLVLRLRQAGRPLFCARDALSAPARPEPPTAADRALLAEKWGAGALRLLESLATALEPTGYRLDPGVRAGLRGER